MVGAGGSTELWQPTIKLKVTNNKLVKRAKAGFEHCRSGHGFEYKIWIRNLAYDDCSRPPATVA